MSIIQFWTSLITATVLNVFFSEFSFGQYKYPVTRTAPFDTVIFNTKLTDHYAWLSRPEHEKEMLSWSRTQGEFTNSLLDSIPGTEQLEQIIKKIYVSNPDEIIVKGTQSDDVYYYKTMSDSLRWLVRKSGNAPEEKIASLPFTIKSRKYRGKKFAFAHRKKLLALMMVESGESNPHIRFFDLEAKTFLTDSIGAVMFNDASGVSMAWLPDDSGLIYSQAPPTNPKNEQYYRGQLKLHLLGKKAQADEPVFGFNINQDIDLKEYETPYVYTFPHSPFIIARVRAGKGDNYAYAIHYSKLNGRHTGWVKLNGYKSNHGTFTANGKSLYAIDDAVSNMQLIKVDLEKGGAPAIAVKETEKILAMSTGDPSIIGGKNVMYVKYNAPGKQGILKIKYADFEPSDLPLPFDGSIAEFNLIDDDDLLFVLTNWVRDYEYYLVSHAHDKVSPYSGKSNTAASSNYVSKIIHIKSRDGQMIPVSLVYNEKIKLQDKPRPLLIDAYGCFGASMDPAYNPENFIWLEAGGIYAAAHIRGGSELGAQWHAGGSYPNKMNSINDIVDIADYFVKNNFTTGSQQAITGASCGTLNVGLATVQRPDLFSAGVYMVGIPDLVTNKGSSFGRGQNDFGPLDTQDGFHSRYSISAYYKIVKNKSAPAMLVINGANDYIVPLHNAARYVAKLQNEQQSTRPALFLVDWKNGHAAAGKDPEDVLRIWKYLLWQTGHPDFQFR